MRLISCLALLLLLTFSAGAENRFATHYLRLCFGYDYSVEVGHHGSVRLAKLAQDEGQCWKFTAVGRDTYHISSALLGDKKLLTYRDGGLVVAAADTSENQLWTVKSEGDRVTLANSGHVLTASDNLSGPFMVKVGETTGASQLWIPVAYRLLTAPPPEAGNFLSNAGPVQGRVSSGSQQAGALWVVVVSRLRCHEQPDVKSKVVTTLSKGARIQADLGRGGSDEVSWNTVDDQGNTWMRVRSPEGKSLNAYVRANSRYIRPVSP